MSRIEVKVEKVIKRDGRIVDFDVTRIENAIRKAMLATNSYNKEILEKVISYILLIINEKYKEKYPHVEEIQDIVEFSLMKYGLFETAKAYVLYRKERERIREEKKKILQKSEVDEVDKNFSINALRILASRYLLRDEEGKIIESPKQLFQRVAALIVIPDILHDSRIFDKNGLQKIHDKEDFNPEEYEFKIGLKEIKWNRWHLERMKNLYDELNSQGKMKVSWKKFLEMLSNGEFNNYYEKFMEYYRIMVEKKFMPNSPTLFNAGARLGQLSACFVLDIDDNIESIMETVKEASIIFKTGGGVGINYSKLRPEGDVVASTSGTASGPCSFMRIIDVTTDVIKQGGKRRGANMGILNASHPEIEKFITLKSTEGVLENFNISVALNKDFWDAYEKDEPYFLINPRNGKIVKKIDPKHLLEIIALSAWKTADPGVLFLDNINKRNILKKARGEITATNPCVVGDTLISTEYGLMRMKDLVKKYPNGGIKIAIDNRVPIQIMNPDGTISLMQNMQKGVNFNTISRAFCTGLKEVYKIITKSGYELIATPDHKVLTNRGWVRIIDLKPLEHKVLIQSGEGKFNNNYQLPFNVKNEYKGRNGRLYKLNLPTKWSKELGQVLGWLIGNGLLRDGKNCRVGFKFSKENKKILEYFKSIINKWYNFNVKEIKRKNGVYHLSYHSKFFVDFFKKLGVKSVDAKEKVVPESIFTAPKEAVIGFLQGLFTANGTIGYDENNGNYYIRLTSKSKKLLKDVQILLLNLGIKTKIYDRSRKTRKIFPYKNKSGKIKYYEVDGECYELHISRESIKNFINKIGFLLNKYHNKINKLKMKDFYETIFEDEILLIEPYGKEYVYDLTEPKTFSFISNGIISLDCGEQPLYPYESCNLGSINLYAFIKRDIEGNVEFDWKELEKTIRIAIDFLDNVIDVNKYPLKKIEERTKESRKIGLGMMGLADTLFALKIPYNSEEGFEFMRKIAEFIDYHAYIRSIERAKERGAFPLFEKSSYVDGEMPVEGFYHKDIWNFDWDKVIEMIKKYGVRNSNLTSIAPTGTISMIVDTSSGLEPQFALIYEKTVTIGKFYYVNQELEIQLRERGLYSEKIIEKIAENGGSLQEIDEIPEDLKKVFVTAYDIPWWDHIRAQYEIGLWVDAGISKTINMANWVSVEDVKNAYLFAYKLGLKGITIYRDGSKTKQVLTTPTQRRGKYLKIVENKTIDMLNKYGIKVTIEEKEEKINSLPFLKMDIPKFNLLPKEVKKKAKREVCPMCQSQSLVYHESCVTCMNCGWSECVEA